MSTERTTVVTYGLNTVLRGVLCVSLSEFSALRLYAEDGDSC